MRTRLIGVIILAIIGFTISECSSADRNDSGDIVKSGDVQAFETRVGDCFNELPADGETFSSIKAVPCNEAHQYQLFYRGTSTLTSFSEDSARQEASEVCNEAADTLFNQMSAIKYDAFKNADLGFFYPTSKSWASNDDRALECLIGSDVETYFTSVFDESLTDNS
jgi:hypothetical protein